MSKFILILLVIISCSNCKSLNQKRDSATYQLNALKEGVLFVRLPTNEAKIARLKEMGKQREAKKEAMFMKQFHLDIMKTFSQDFNFCPVYFYYSNVSKEVKGGAFDKNIFDADRKNVDHISMERDHHFFAEFGYVHQEELTSTDQDGNSVKVAGIGGKNALVIRTKEGLQPTRPFPYSVGYNYRGSNSLKKSIQKLNDRLYNVYSKMERRKLRRGL